MQAPQAPDFMVFTGNAADFLKAGQALWTRVVKARGITRE